VALGHLFCLALFMRNWLHLRAFGGGDIGFLGLFLPRGFWRLLFAMTVFSLLLSLLLALLLDYIAPLFGIEATVAIAVIVLLYCAARFSFYFVGLALHHPLTLREALHLARPVTLRLLAIIFLIQLPFGLLQFVLLNLIALWGLAEIAPWASSFVLIVLDLLRLALIADVLFLFFGTATSIEVTA
jgi:hypothetical protein